jgi:hypothetical protein
MAAKRKFKWTAKRRAAFKKMRAGLARSRRVVTRRRVRKSYRRPVARRRVVARRFRNPYAMIANPGGALVPYNAAFAAHQRRKPKMARRRKRRRVARRRPARRRRVSRRRYTAPVRRRRRRSPRRRSTSRRRRGRAVIYINPRRRRGRRLRRRRNPGMGGMIGRVMTPFAVGFVTSMAAAGIDTVLSKSPKLAQLAKVGGAFLIAFAGRRYPTASIAAIASLAGSMGYPLGVKLAGGLVATSPAQAVAGLGAMSRTYPQMGALLSGGIGALLSDAPSNLPTVASNYMMALRNNVTDDD